MVLFVYICAILKYSLKLVQLMKAIIIYGPPGSGKGTQADILAKQLNIVHFDIGAHIDEVVHDPKNANDSKIQEEKKTFDAGGICDPIWVANLAASRMKEIARLGFGLVLSGSLRTLHETLGDGKTPGLLKVLEDAYGSENLLFFLLEVQPEISIARNSSRLRCSVCGKGVMFQYLNCAPKGCPVCGGPLRKRTDDDPKIITRRLKAYKRDTEPVFNELRQRGYKIIPVNGGQAPYLVNKEMLAKLK